MAEQKLDVRVSESGTATVVSTLEKLEKKLGDVEKAQQAETATTEKAVATLDKMSEGLAAFFDRQSSKMAVIEKAAGLLGKFNLAFELVGKAIKAGEYILDNYINKVKEFEPALDGVNKKLAIQLDLTKKLSAARGEIALLGGSAEQQQRAAALAFTIAEAEEVAKVTATEIERAQVVAARNQQAREDHARAVKQYNEEVRLLQKLEGGRARAGAGPAAPVLDTAPDITTLENKGKQAAEALRAAREELEALRKSLQPEGPKGRGRGAPEGQSTTAEGQTQGATEALTGGAVNLQTMGAVVTATAELQTQLDSTAASWAEVGEASLQAGADMRRAAAVSVVAAALQGKSIIKALGAVLTAKSQEYLVESLDWGLKAAGFALFGNPAAGAAAAIAAGYLAASGVAAGAGALFGGGGGGGGRGGGGGTAPAVGATGPRAPAQADAGGPLTVNVTIDGMAIATRDSIAAGLIEGLQHAASTPGRRAQLRRALDQRP